MVGQFNRKDAGAIVLVVLLVLGAVGVILRALHVLPWPWAWSLSPFWLILILFLILTVIANFDWWE